jgi:hypothetical protein
VTELVYLYAVVRRPPAAPPRGIGGQPVRFIADGDVAAAVSDVPAAEFDEEPLNAGMTDMSWLGPRAVAHQDVNQQLHEQAEAVLPLAFGTVFRDDARVRALLTQQSASFRERLERVRGRSEWVVAVHRVGEPDTSASPAVQAMHAEIGAAAPGRAHLLKRRLAEVERDELRRLELETIGSVLSELRAVADDVFSEPLPADAVERPLLRASVLLRHADESRFLDLVDRLGSPGLRLLLTGPWPPYRFGGLEHAAATR